MSRNASPPSDGADVSPAGKDDAAAGITPGTFVRDADGDSGVAVVTYCHCRPIADVYVEVETDDGAELLTVADLNDDYPADEPCVQIAFIEDVEGATLHWREIDRAMLHPRLTQADVTLYDYPRGRLEVVDNE